MKSVMISGHFDPFHHGHLSYVKQAIALMPSYLICVISSDEQLMMKKGKVNIPELHRLEIVQLILDSLSWHGRLTRVIINKCDTHSILVVKALRKVRPDIFFRGGDKTLEDMPLTEKRVCEELGIEIRHATLEYDVHGSQYGSQF